MKRMTIALAVSLAGCTSSGVIPIGQDTFMISKQSSTGFHSAGSVKAEIYREGYAYCVSQGKEFQPISDRGVDGVVGVSYANAEIQFRCLSKGDPELSRPTMRPIPNIRIENDARDKKDIRVQDSGDLYTELRKLKDLLDSKVITQEEFDAQKKKILAK
jgi:hypothetical protein